jgi:uncharacterized ferritin-like protein (DUF455 family)
MEIRQFAERILSSASLDEKLAPAAGPWTDDEPGEPWCPAEPARPEELRFAPTRRTPAMPHPLALRDPGKRAVAHHIMANHELQAVEVMARTLVAFPDAPPEFRRGLVRVIGDEQRHTRLHVRHARRLGLEFGGLPVNGHIWRKSIEFQSVLDYIAGLPLVFEAANLDHSLELEAAFRAAGDEKSAAVMRVIHTDEIEHVRFGLEWLRRLKPRALTDWEAFAGHLHWPLRPAKARGDTFHREPRRAAGMTGDFLDQLEHARPETE